MLKQKELFKTALKNNRLAHAYIFTGPEGAGKLRFAREIADMLGAHPVMDVITAGLEKPITVEEARLLQSQLSLTPVGRAKVAIIVGAESLSDAVANCLLKTLEEPPGHSYIFLLSHNFYGLLPTVASRAQRVNFQAKVSSAIIPADFPAINNVLLAGSTADRLQAAADLAERESAEIENFLKYAARQWTQNPNPPVLGKKLLDAWKDLHYNLNTKLLLDNLFLN